MSIGLILNNKSLTNHSSIQSKTMSSLADSIILPEPCKLLRQQCSSDIYGAYCSLNKVHNLPYVSYEECFKSPVTFAKASNEAYKMALFMSQHPCIKKISYDELQTLLQEQEIPLE